MKSSLRLFLIAIAVVLSAAACSVNPGSSPAGGAGTAASESGDLGSATMAIDLSGGSSINPSMSGISADMIGIDDYTVTNATITLANTKGDVYTGNWVPGQSSVFSFNLKRLGSYSLTITSSDNGNNINTTSTNLLVQNQHNYRLRVQLGGNIVTSVVDNSEGLIAEYLLNGDALDATTNGYNGVMVGAPTFTAGRSGNGMQVDATHTNYIELPKAMLLSLTNKGTIDMWVKSEFSSVDNTVAHIFLDTDAPLSKNKFYMGLQNGSIYAQVFYDNTGTWMGGESTPVSFASLGVSFAANEWHHWAMCWDINGINGTADKFRFYFDGVLLHSTVNIPNQLPIFSKVFLGKNSNINKADSILENVRFWNFAKTDFSDR